jgi:phosphoribosylaminoimidazole (AIR) synthetase
MPQLTERAVGVADAQSGLSALLRWVRPTFDNAPDARPVLDIGLLRERRSVAPNLGIAISTDGVGTKLLVAQQAGASTRSASTASQ